MANKELLAQLADIHLPEPVGYWPPAIGWWLVALLIFIGLIILLWKFAAYRRQQKVCQYALTELNSCYDTYSHAEPGNDAQNKLNYINRFNTVIRRVALVHYPQSNVASLDGSPWVDFIREKGDSSLLTEEIAVALQYGRFQAKCDVDVDSMHDFGERWIRKLYSERTGSNKQLATNPKD
jgi:hypothetical protein